VASEPGTPFVIRPSSSADMAFLREMLYEAAYWRPDGPRPSLAEGLARPDLAHLLAGWGREGDLALVAEMKDGTPAGAAWLRFWTPEQHSYGFIDGQTPEMGIGVRTQARNKGIGAALITSLLTEAKRQGIRCISLSVERDNPAARLYRRAGFVVHAAVGGSWTMVVDLPLE
jgi:ribosomal protein S18 acetylase RimI-like enzyme